MNITTTASKLLTQKLLVAFLVGFASYGIPRLLDALDAVNATGNYHFSRSVAVSFLAGAIGAALRYALAVSPINLTATDRLHTAGAGKDETVVVRKDAAK